MITIQEGKLEFQFPDKWHATAYDKWSFYQDRFKDCCCGNKAVDILARDPARTVWMIEVKDYRQHRRTKDIHLWDEIAIKARDTLAGLVAAKFAIGHPQQNEADMSLSASKLRVILHLEQPVKHSKLFPRVFDPEIMRLKLRQLLKPIDAHPRVIELNNMVHVPWTASPISRPES